MHQEDRELFIFFLECASPRDRCLPSSAEVELNARVYSIDFFHVFFTIIVVTNNAREASDKLTCLAAGEQNFIDAVSNAILFKKLPDISIITLVTRSDNDDLVALSIALELLE